MVPLQAADLAGPRLGLGPPTHLLTDASFEAWTLTYQCENIRGTSGMGLAEAGYLTHATVFDIDALPASLVVIGGGPVVDRSRRSVSGYPSQYRSHID